jgi:hypothetical protein
MAKSKSPQTPAQPTTNIEIVCQEQPIIVPRDAEPPEQSPLPAENAPWSRFILIGGTIAVLTFLSWVAPAQTQALWQSFIQQMFQLAKLP